MAEKRNIFNEIIAALEHNTRGAQIGIYTIAGISLAVAIHKVRPISKFSRLADVPEHFIKTKEVLRGHVVGCLPSAEGPLLLIDHAPLVKIPLWHAGKPALPVQIWGVKLVGGNGVSWLQCVAVGQKVEMIPLGRGSDALIADVTLQLPVLHPMIDKKKKQATQQIEEIKVGERLVELGLGLVSTEVSQVPVKADSKWFWLPWIFQQRSDAELLQRAQSRAMAHRAGIWQYSLPQSRIASALYYLKSITPSLGTKKLQSSVL